MRHFEEYEIENLFNSTGTFYFRLCCRLHLKHCALCRSRYARVQEEMRAAEKFRKAVARFADPELFRAPQSSDGDKQ